MLIVTTTALTALSTLMEQQAFRDEMEKETELILAIMENSMIDELYFMDAESLSDLLENLSDINRVFLSARIFDAEGRVLADSSDESLTYSTAIDDFGFWLISSQASQFTWFPDRLHAGKPVIVGGTVLGAIGIERPTVYLAIRITELRNSGIIVAVLALATGLVVSLLVSRSITRPLSRIAVHTAAIADGNFHQFLEIDREDELGQLSEAINNMSIRLRGLVERLRENEERYSLSLQGAKDGIWDWDLRTNRLFFSPRWLAMLDLEEGAIEARPEAWFERVHSKDSEELQAKLEDHFSHGSDFFQHEYRMRANDGSYRWFLSRGTALFDQNEKAYRIAGSHTDITDRKISEEKLQRQALYDNLTQLPNRTLLLDRLERLISLERRGSDEGSHFAVLFIDLDGFKLINDSYGHRVGDETLIAVSHRLSQGLRSSDTLARIGGDEFVILLVNIREVRDVTVVTNRILSSLTQPIELESNHFYLTASIGIALDTGHYEYAEDIVRDADIAMYRAKGQGKNRVELFDLDMRSEVQHYLAVKSNLQHALDGNEFRVHYQPIISLSDRKILGFEALLRWKRDDGSSTPPDQFIPIAEETGLVVAITSWLLEDVGRQIRLWSDQFPWMEDTAVCINLSAKDFSAHESIVKKIATTLQRFRLDASRLRIEITESAILNNVDQTIHQLEELSLMGIRIELDDFGTGQSSLSYLHQLPIDVLKIDRSFVNTIAVNEESMSIVRAIATLAKELRIEIIAEGVETEEQAAFLHDMGCQYAQGYLYSPAIGAEEVDSWVQRFSIETTGGGST